ncbi:MAG: MBL fold metallo-hydrolase [Desulfobacteraceae bacterium]|nr:MBL fold metallo-hydrolase [Desulfobacteraceae bacterium]
MIIESLTVGPIQANCFVVGCEDTRKAAVIDPGDEADRILMSLAEHSLKVEAIINTHGHFDHVGANRRMKEATGAPIIIHAADAGMLQSLAASAASWGMTAENSPDADRTVEDGDEISVGNITFRVLHTPGHTPGGISLYADGVVFVGDALFAGSIGRTDFPGGDYGTLINAIQNKLFTLPDDTVVYAGHMGTTTIGREKRTNPFARIG